MLPLIAPGVASGALFAVAASFDEVVTVLFMGGLEQRTIPRQMWTGIREQISPAILARGNPADRVFLAVHAERGMAASVGEGGVEGTMNVAEVRTKYFLYYAAFYSKGKFSRKTGVKLPCRVIRLKSNRKALIG